MSPEDPPVNPVAHDRARRSVVSAIADDPGDGRSLLQQVTRAAARSMSMAGCAVHMVSRDGESGVATSTNPLSALLADVSFTTGDGPAFEALRLRRPVLVSDLVRHRHRWPGFVDTAGGAGVRAVYCFPLQVGGVILGVLDLYSERDRALDDEEVSLALAYTHLAALTILGDHALTDQGWVQGPWEPLVDHRAEIHQAQGMVMVDLGVDLAEALLRMRAHAYSEGRPLIEIAQAIIQGLELPAAGTGEPV